MVPSGIDSSYKNVTDSRSSRFYASIRHELHQFAMKTWMATSTQWKTLHCRFIAKRLQIDSSMAGVDSRHGCAKNSIDLTKKIDGCHAFAIVLAMAAINFGLQISCKTIADRLERGWG
jgi:hypothetical protein